MIPGLALVGRSSRSRAAIPIPLFLAWPLIAISAAGIEVLARLPLGRRRTRERVFAVRAAFRLLFSLSGLEVDVRPRSGPGFHLRLL